MSKPNILSLLYPRRSPTMKLLFLITALFYASLALAQSGAKDIEAIQQAIQKSVGSVEVKSVAETPIEGLYEVHTLGNVNYMSADGRYIVTGDLYDQQTNTNITEQIKGTLRKARMDNYDDDKMLVYKAVGEEKYVLTVFTDTSCGYCRKLHDDMDTLNKAGITVRYLLYPRMGLQAASASVMESVWCADDPLAAMDKAKSGRTVATATCDNPIEEHLALGREFGLRGTPMLVAQDGVVIPGYMPPDTLKTRLGIQ